MPSTCVRCGTERADDNQICAYHLQEKDSSWAEENRLINNLLMRGVEPPRVEKPVVLIDELQPREVESA